MSSRLGPSSSFNMPTTTSDYADAFHAKNELRYNGIVEQIATHLTECKGGNFEEILSSDAVNDLINDVLSEHEKNGNNLVKIIKSKALSMAAENTGTSAETQNSTIFGNRIIDAPRDTELDEIRPD